MLVAQFLFKYGGLRKLWGKNIEKVKLYGKTLKNLWKTQYLNPRVLHIHGLLRTVHICICKHSFRNFLPKIPRSIRWFNSITYCITSMFVCYQGVIILTPWYYLLVDNSIIFGYGWHVGSPQEQLTLLQKPQAPMSDDLAMSLKQDCRINQGASLLLSSRFKWPHLLYSYYLKRNHMCDCSMFFYSMITILRCTHHLVFELSDPFLSFTSDIHIQTIQPIQHHL